MVPLEYENDELLKQKKINRTIDFKVKGLRTGAAEAAYYSLEFFFFFGGGRWSHHLSNMEGVYQLSPKVLFFFTNSPKLP